MRISDGSSDVCSSDLLNTQVPRPDIVVVSGDLVDFGRPDEYAALHPELARLHMPCYLVPGNHDNREHLRAAFADHRYLPIRPDAPLDWVVDAIGRAPCRERVCQYV